MPVSMGATFLHDHFQYALDPLRYVLDPFRNALEPFGYALDPLGYALVSFGYALDPFGYPFGYALDLFGYARDPFDYARDPFDYAPNPFGYALDPFGYALDPFGYALDPFGYALNPFGGPGQEQAESAKGQLSAVGSVVRLMLSQEGEWEGGRTLESVLPDYQRTMDSHTNVATRYTTETIVRAAFTPGFKIPEESQAREAHGSGSSAG